VQTLIRSRIAALGLTPWPDDPVAPAEAGSTCKGMAYSDRVVAGSLSSKRVKSQVCSKSCVENSRDSTFTIARSDVRALKTMRPRASISTPWS